MEKQGTGRAKTDLKKSEVKDFKNCYKATIIKTMCYWQKDTDQWKRTDSSEIVTQRYGHWFLTKI